MLGVKRIDTFVLKKFFVMFLGCFCICLFVFMMQFVWRYIDTLVGKGLGMDVLAQFFFYMAVSLVPMALPMAILLTSLITFGNMGEQLELTAMKAAGIPLIRIMRPLIVSCTLLMFTSYYFQNTISPKAQLELARLLMSMKEKSPALEIPEGVFYNGIPGVNLYVEHKQPETGMLYNVIIYKMDRGIENAQIVVADSARLETTADKHFLKLSIFSGEQFENLQSTSTNMLSGAQVPYDRETFQYKNFLIDFNTDFDLLNAESLAGRAETKSQQELTHDIDSMTHVYDSIGVANYQELSARYMQTGYMQKKDSAAALAMSKRVNLDTALLSLSAEQRLRVFQRANSDNDNILTEIQWRSPVSQDGWWMVRRHQIKWHEKFTSSLSCLFFFFIGAPLGAIIRKGGLGVSTILSVLIFIIYYIIGTSGMKLARDGTLNITFGMWISTIVMAPLGIWLTYKANKDSAVFNFDALCESVLRLLGYRQPRTLQRKEIIIHEPDYGLCLQQLQALTAEALDIRRQLHLSRPANYFRLFFQPQEKNRVADLSEHMEALIRQLSNSESARLVMTLNNYPNLYLSAHLSPVKNRWANMAMGILFPIGIAVWLKICKYRSILDQDITRIVNTNAILPKYINGGQGNSAQQQEAPPANAE